MFWSGYLWCTAICLGVLAWVFVDGCDCLLNWFKYFGAYFLLTCVGRYPRLLCLCFYICILVGLTCHCFGSFVFGCLVCVFSAVRVGVY